MIKILIKFIGGVIILLIIALIFLNFYISTISLRHNLSLVLSNKTGYIIELKQAPSLKLLPELKASLYAVSLQDKASKTELSYVDRIDIFLSPWSLLKGNVSFTKIRLVHPKIKIEEPVQDISKVILKLFSPKAIINQQLKDIIIQDAEIYAKNGTVINNLNGVINFAAKSPNISFKANNLDLRLNIGVDKQAIKLSNIELNYGKTNITGAVQILYVKKYSIVGSLAASNVNLTDILKHWPNDKVYLDLRISAKNARYMNYLLDNIALSLQKDKKNLYIAIANANSNIGRFYGNIKMTNKLCDIHFNIINGDVIKLIALLDINFPISGKCNAVVDLKAKMNKLDMKLLKLDASATIDEANIIKYDLEPVLEQASIRKIKKKNKEYNIPYQNKLCPIAENDKLSSLKFNIIYTPNSFVLNNGSVSFANKNIKFQAWRMDKDFVIKAKQDDINFWLLAQEKEPCVKIIALKGSNRNSEKELEKLWHNNSYNEKWK